MFASRHKATDDRGCRCLAGFKFAKEIVDPFLRNPDEKSTRSLGVEREFNEHGIESLADVKPCAQVAARALGRARAQTSSCQLMG